MSLEKLAEAHDLVFMPTGARHDGKLLFTFGRVPVYMDPDKHIVCARRPAAHRFEPISLSKLVEAATASSGAPGANGGAPGAAE